MYKGLLTRNSHYSDFVELTLFNVLVHDLSLIFLTCKI